MKNWRSGGIISTTPIPRSRPNRRERDVVRHQPVDPVGCGGERDAVEPPPALVALEHVAAAEIEAEPRRVEHRLGQSRDILQAEIESLARDRMDRMRRIADEREALLRIAAREVQLQRIGPARSDRIDLAQMVAEAQRAVPR